MGKIRDQSSDTKTVGSFLRRKPDIFIDTRSLNNIFTPNFCIRCFEPMAKRGTPGAAEPGTVVSSWTWSNEGPRRNRSRRGGGECPATQRGGLRSLPSCQHKYATPYLAKEGSGAPPHQRSGIKSRKSSRVRQILNIPFVCTACSLPNDKFIPQPRSRCGRGGVRVPSLKGPKGYDLETAQGSSKKSIDRAEGFPSLCMHSVSCSQSVLPRTPGSQHLHPDPPWENPPEKAPCAGDERLISGLKPTGAG